MGKTLVRNKDIAPVAPGYTGIETDKLTDASQNNQFLTAVQKTALTTGVNADVMHWHAGAGAISAQFGSNRLVPSGMSIEANGIPSNICGIPLINDGQILSVGVVVATAPISDVQIEIEVGTAAVVVIIPAGQRRGSAKNLSANFLADNDMTCKVILGQANKPSVFVEFRWR